MRFCTLLVACAGLIGSACSSSSAEPATSCVGHASSADSTATASPVSMQNDVLPIFAQSCSFSACHGSPSGDDNGIFLGLKGSANASTVRAALVAKSSTHMPSMKLVTPGQPETSFLVHKLEGDFCALDACADGKCGERMPRGWDALDPAALATIRAWIAQGAPAN